MPCVSIPTCTHVIIISLWLICLIQCGFSISYLSIPGIAAHDRCNSSHVYQFFFSALMWYCVFHLFNCFLGGLKFGQSGRVYAIYQSKICFCPINSGFLILYQDKGVGRIFFIYFLFVVVVIVFAVVVLSLLFNYFFSIYFFIIILICFAFNPICKCICQRTMSPYFFSYAIG